MDLRNLIAAYCLTWFLQLGYLGIILVGWRRLRKSTRPAATDNVLK